MEQLSNWLSSVQQACMEYFICQEWSRVQGIKAICWFLHSTNISWALTWCQALFKCLEHACELAANDSCSKESWTLVGEPETWKLGYSTIHACGDAHRSSGDRSPRAGDSEMYLCCSITKSCQILCDPVDCSMLGLPFLHFLPEFAQTHVHWVGDAIQPPHPLSPASHPALNLSQHQGLFQCVSSSRQVAKVFEYTLS